MATETKPITQEAYQRLLELRQDVLAYETAFKARATEIATLLNYGRDARVTNFGEKYVGYDGGLGPEDGHQFKVELLWDPNYVETIAAYHEQIRRRCDAISAKSRVAQEKRTEEAERAELARLKAKYPNG